MTIKIMLVLYRRPDISHEQFKDYYENTHVKLGLVHLGKLYKNYIRNYLTEAHRLTTYAGRAGEEGSEPLPDAITEIYLEGAEALKEWTAISGNPEIREILLHDEDNFLDRQRSFISFVECEVGPIINP